MERAQTKEYFHLSERSESGKLVKTLEAQRELWNVNVIDFNMKKTNHQVIYILKVGANKFCQQFERLSWWAPFSSNLISTTIPIFTNIESSLFFFPSIATIQFR
jgi:hypothetical protein